MPRAAPVRRKPRYTRAVVGSLQQQLEAKKHELEALQAIHDEAVDEHGFLVALCDKVAQLRQRQAELDAAARSAAEAGEAPPPRRGAFDVASGDELLLLLQLRGVEHAGLQQLQPSPPPSAAAATAAAAAPGSESSGTIAGGVAEPPLTLPAHAGGEIAPPGDPFALWRPHDIIVPPGAERLTLGEVRSRYTQLVQQLSLALVLQDAGTPLPLDADCEPAPSRACSGGGGGGGAAPHDLLRRALAFVPAPADRLEATMWELNALTAVWCAVNPAGMVEMLVTNALNGRRIAEPSKEQHRRALAQMGLSDEQVRRVAVCYRISKRLQAPILEEQKRLQLDQAAASMAGLGVQPPAATPSSSASGATGSTSTCAPTPAPAPEDSVQRAEQIEAAAERVKRIHMLMHKDMLVKTAMSLYLYGCLTWTQLARLYVLLFPFYPTAATFCAVVEEQFLARREQERQHAAAAREAAAAAALIVPRAPPQVPSDDDNNDGDSNTESGSASASSCGDDDDS